MPKKAIPDEVRERAEEVVARFNATRLQDREVRYVPRFKGRFLYLDRNDYGRTSPICRLRYTGDFKKWEFAIYKYSDEAYDSQEWMFPGSQYVDGTIEGAMKAGLDAYPG